MKRWRYLYRLARWFIIVEAKKILVEKWIEVINEYPYRNIIRLKLFPIFFSDITLDIIPVFSISLGIKNIIQFSVLTEEGPAD